MALKNKQQKKKGKKEPSATKKTSSGKRSTFNEDRRRTEAESGKVKRKNLTKAEQGEKLYACLIEDCECTFDAWGGATRHMQICDVGDLPEGKLRLDLSRAKGNALLKEGKAEVKTYPVPTEKDLVKAVFEYYKENKDPKVFKHVLFRVVQKTWGPGDFTRFEFGTFNEFCKKHGFPELTK